MNLILSFVHPSKPPKSVGPFHTVRLDGETVREAQNHTLVAHHREHQWEVEGERYFRLDATTRVHIHFERPRPGGHSRRFGPYGRFSAIDGIAYTDDRVFAFVDPKVGDWFCYNDGHHWPIMVVSDASEGSLRERLRSLAALAPLVPGVIGLWQGGKLLYLGCTDSIAGRLRALAGRFGEAITAITWEAHPEPARREAELLSEYENASSRLADRYGRIHGSQIRTARLVEKARTTVARAATLRRRAQEIRCALPVLWPVS
jgi:hypothetical protein